MGMRSGCGFVIKWHDEHIDSLVNELSVPSLPTLNITLERHIECYAKYYLSSTPNFSTNCSRIV